MALKDKMFPMSVFYDTPKGRVFMTNSFSECSNWVGELRETDYVFFTDAWHVSSAQGTLNIVNAAPYPGNLHFLSNDVDSVYIRSNAGVQNCSLIHKNAWSSQSYYHIDPSVPVVYDAVKNGRLAKFKRHFLAKEVGERFSLALICGQHAKVEIDQIDIPKHTYINDRHIGPVRVNEILNSSRVGLALSAIEGCCFASTEYLLAGIPVVSTKSLGGRDIWYNEWNSAVVEDDPDRIADAVGYFLENPPDRSKIRACAIRQQNEMRRHFVSYVFGPILEKLGEQKSAWDIFGDIDLHLYGAFRGRIWRNIDEVHSIIAAPPSQAISTSAQILEDRNNR